MWHIGQRELKNSIMTSFALIWERVKGLSSFRPRYFWVCGELGVPIVNLGSCVPAGIAGDSAAYAE